MIFSVQPLCPLCLCGDSPQQIDHGDTEDTKVSELFRNALCLNYLEKPSESKFLVSE
jgi:hypothetical protein